jgi:toluene monooxygenase electron transfer component
MTSSHTIKLAGGETTFTCNGGDRVLRAGLRAGLGIPYECNAGGCGSCKFQLVSGEVLDLWPDAPGIRPNEREKGRRLGCQCVPLTDCEIKLRPAPEYVPLNPPRRLPAKFVGSKAVTSDIREFTFQSSAPASFIAGQYAMIALPGASGERAYSMSNQPNEKGEWSFMVRKVPGGNVSPRLFDELTAGTALEIDGPYGLAYLRNESERDIVCLAGGSGLAPIVSIVNAATTVATSAANKKQRGIWLFYGGRGPADIPAIGDFIHAHADVQFHPAISAPELAEGTNWAGEVCFVHEMLPRKLPNPLPQYDFYLAGPPPMIEAVMNLLMEHEVPIEQIRFDRFF